MLVTLAALRLPRRGGLAHLAARRAAAVPPAGRTLWGRLPWLVVLELAAVAARRRRLPAPARPFAIAGVALALAVLVGGTALTALGAPAAQPPRRPPVRVFFGAEGLLGRANLGRDRPRTGLTVGALIIGLARS